MMTIFSQVVWSPLKEGAQALYNVIKKMEFTSQSYDDLLELYNVAMAKKGGAEDEAAVVRRVACDWLLEPGGMRNSKQVARYKSYTGGPMKQKLLIGGIFPLGGDKFTARELLPGN